MGKAKSAELLMQLYDLRREKTMRKARKWISTFFPQSTQEVMDTMMDPEVGGYLRMVISYWDMAASFVNHGAIHADMFNDTNGEHLIVYCKIRPFLAELREIYGRESYLVNLEKVVMDHPDGAARIEKVDKWLRDFQERVAAEASASAG
jgi:hypothetical protein